MNLWSIRDNEMEDRSFLSFEDEAAVEIAASIIEQAVEDWKELDYGRLNRALGRPDSTFVYAEEVMLFFQSRWFEHLLSFALPTHSAKQVRRALGVPEPRRRVKCAKH